MTQADKVHPKGQYFNGSCNVTACQKPGAQYWNTSTRAFYCAKCAKQINEVLMSTPDLCVHPYNMPMPSQYNPSHVSQPRFVGLDDHDDSFNGHERRNGNADRRKSPPAPCHHTFGNMASRPRPCMQCGKSEDEVIAEKTGQLLDDAHKRFHAEHSQPVDSSDVVEVALRKAQDTFLYYEKLHRAKPDHEKADRNRDLAMEMTQALAAMQPCAGMGEDEAVDIMLKGARLSGPLSTADMREAYRALLTALNGAPK